jgi:AcrR family transcriptional regulator
VQFHVLKDILRMPGTAKRTRQVALEQRLAPTQQRARESVELILTTTARLLDEVGLEAFNTNLLAERAGIRVRTVYRYFPNKYAVIFALTKELAVGWERSCAPMYEALRDPKADWRRAMREHLLEWIEQARHIPGSLCVLSAMNATPELTDLHVQNFETMSQNMAVALKTRGLRVPQARLQAIARTITNSLNSSVDVLLRLRGNDFRLFAEESTVSLEAYLERFLDK